MKYLLGIILILLLLGCSSSGDLTAPGNERSLPSSEQPERLSMLWDYGLFRVSEDHTSIERIPYRASTIPLNVTKFVEPPNCGDCMNIGQPSIQADGSFKVNVTLRHPFPMNPEFTGFDVRGTLIFPATRYWEARGNVYGWYNIYEEPMFEDKVPYNFSRAVDGGGELLNADGYTMYFFPGFEVPGFSQPIFKYKKGKQAYGPDPDSTISGYKLFTNDVEKRRMFLVTDTITRTYHIRPPDGEFNFGYVVYASWAWPETLPVTDPAVDFPFWANCEDGYILNIEKHNPFKLGYWEPTSYYWHPPITERDIYTITSLFDHFDDSGPSGIHVSLFCPDLTDEIYNQERGVAFSNHHECIDLEKKIFTNVLRIREGTFEAEPGTYVALICVQFREYTPAFNDWPVVVRWPSIFEFVELEVVPAD